MTKSPQHPVERFDLREIPRVHRQVVMTTGSHHYQTYWVTGSEQFGNLLQTLPLVYLVKDHRWIPREAAFMVPPDIYFKNVNPETGTWAGFWTRQPVSVALRRENTGN